MNLRAILRAMQSKTTFGSGQAVLRVWQNLTGARLSHPGLIYQLSSEVDRSVNLLDCRWFIFQGVSAVKRCQIGPLGNLLAFSTLLD